MSIFVVTLSSEPFSSCVSSLSSLMHEEHKYTRKGTIMQLQWELGHTHIHAHSWAHKCRRENNECIICARKSASKTCCVHVKGWCNRNTNEYTQTCTHTHTQHLLVLVLLWLLPLPAHLLSMSYTREKGGAYDSDVYIGHWMYLVPILMSITEGLSKSLRRSAISMYTERKEEGKEKEKRKVNHWTETVHLK